MKHVFILVDEISSRGSTYQLPDAVLHDLRKDEDFIADLRRGVRLMVCSWGWVCFFFLLDYSCSTFIILTFLSRILNKVNYLTI